ncbi:MAG TPA: gamma-glutamyl-gamma-aminobutyrate hydrolase family protein, partial [Alphaproteobacteria bacterium]|nr:gamma-glutamyl-gamma-aminobutyrate hydrolase family protein [Alphaproteobacteria bacterium]
AELYGGKINPDIRIDPERDALERRVLDWAERLRLPVLGICRGAQMINVHRGGSLHTDIYEVYEQAPKLRTVLPRKTVTIAEGSRLRALLGAGEVRVNALHHQSIDRPGRGLTPVAHDRYGIVQGIEGGPAEHAGFLFGVQWHPEFLVADRRSLGLFRALAAAAAGRTAPAPAPPPRGAEARR